MKAIKYIGLAVVAALGLYGLLYACLLNISNEGQEIELLVAADGSEAIIMQPGETMEFGSSTKRAKFYRMKKGDDNRYHPTHVITQVGCSENHMIDMNIANLDKNAPICTQPLFSVEPYTESQPAASGSEMENMDMSTMESSGDLTPETESAETTQSEEPTQEAVSTESTEPTTVEELTEATMPVEQTSAELTESVASEAAMPTSEMETSEITSEKGLTQPVDEQMSTIPEEVTQESMPVPDETIDKAANNLPPMPELEATQAQ